MSDNSSDLPQQGEWRAAVREDVRAVMREEYQATLRTAVADVVREALADAAPKLSPTAPEQPQAIPPDTAGTPDSPDRETEESTATPLNVEEQAAEVIRMANMRADLIVRAQPFLPPNFDAATSTDEDILRSALGKAYVDGSSVDYMRGQLGMMGAEREAAAAQRAQYAGATRTPDAAEVDTREATTESSYHQQFEEYAVSDEREAAWQMYKRSFSDEDIATS